MAPPGTIRRRFFSDYIVCKLALDERRLPYSLDIIPDSRDHVTLGLSLDLMLLNDLNLGLDYRTSFGGAGNQDHVFGLKVDGQF